MDIEIKNWSKDPTISAIVKATFPNYKRRTVYIQATESVTLHDLNWSGGTRSEYRAVKLSGERMGSSARYNAMAPWDNIAEGKTIPLPQGAIMVCGGHFCGKESLLRLYVHPADMPKYITK